MTEEASNNPAEAVLVLQEDFDNITVAYESAEAAYGSGFEYIFCLIPLVPLWCVLYMRRVQLMSISNNQDEVFLV